MRTENGAQLHPAQFRNRRWRLRLARSLWLASAVLAIGLFAVNLPPHYAQLRAFTALQLHAPAAVRAGLLLLGIPFNLYFGVWMVVLILIPTVFITVGALIFWRRADDGTAWFFSLTLVMFGVAWPNTLSTLPMQTSFWWFLRSVIEVFGYTSFFLLFYLFPDGRFIPRWTRWSAALFLAFSIIDVFANDTSYDLKHWPAPYAMLGQLILLIFYVTMLIAQFYRYRYVSNTVQRQQTKWVSFGLAVALSSIVGTGIVEGLPLVQQPIAAAVFSGVSIITYGIVPLLVPLTIGIAVLHHHLFDIDLIIRRTLVYTVLSVALALIYLGSVLLLQEFFRSVTGASSSFTIVLSTLLIAVLITPLRRRIQAGIDRRFYRRKYDAERVLAAFSVVARNEVDLAELTQRLVQVVEETLQPQQVSFWLREPPSK